MFIHIYIWFVTGASAPFCSMARTRQGARLPDDIMYYTIAHMISRNIHAYIYIYIYIYICVLVFIYPILYSIQSILYNISCGWW